MSISDFKVHSFIVKLWQQDDDTGKTKWHGSITHVPDAAQRYFQNLRDISRFIKPYLTDNTTEAAVLPDRPGWLKWIRRKLWQL